MARRNLTRGLVLALLLLLADQLSKWWILNGLELPLRRSVPLFAAGPFTLDFSMVWNRGVTFGLLTGSEPWHAWLLAALAAAIAIFLIGWMARAENTRTARALGAVVGGAVGNVIDRMRFGAVVDFVDAGFWGWHWYVFNLADAGIVLGVLVLLAEAVFGARRPAPAADGA